MNNTATKTRCETVDQIISWTDGTGRLNIVVGDLVVHDGQFEQVTEIHYNPTEDMHVAVGFEGRSVLSRKHPDELIAVRRYIETGKE